MKTPVVIPTQFQDTQRIRQALKRTPGTLFIQSMADLPHGVFYGDGETRYLANGGNWDLIVFQRTGTGNDDGNWITVATTTGILSWPTGG